MREIKDNRLVLPRVESNSTVVLDVETNGLDWKRHYVVGYAIGLGPKPSDTFYVPVRHASGNYPIEPFLHWLNDITSNPTIRIVGQNLKFDLHFAANDGLVFKGPIECTMVNAALIDENLYSYSLETLAKAYDVPFPKVGDQLYRKLANIFGGTADRKVQMPNFHRADPSLPEVQAYVRSDVLATWHIWERQQHFLDQQDLRRVWAVECRVLRTLLRMERRGVRVDEERAHAVREELVLRAEKMKKKLPKDLNVRSPKQLKAWFATKGITSGWPQTEKGNDSFPEAWLSTHEPGKLIVAIRKTTNIVNSFLDPLINDHIFKGRAHTCFNQLRQDDYGTVTGRLSSSDPNMQQVPKRDKQLAPLFRSIFLPDKGFRWSANDFSQQEFRVFAEYSRAPLLIEGYKAHPPVDIHTTVAELLGVERDPTAKRMNLGMLYGMGVRKLADSLGVEERVAKSYRAQYDAVLPEARKFLREAEHWAKRRGYVRTKLGRRRRLEASLAHKAGNSVIQGSSADITKTKMVEIDDFFREQHDAAHLLLQVHDELDWQVPAKSGKALDDKARAIMESFGPNDLITMDVPMKVDAKSGRNWAEATYGALD